MFIVSLNVGTKQEPKMLYYAGYRTYPDRERNLPSGPILLAERSEAWTFETQQQAEVVARGDDRLQGAKVEEL